VIGSPNGNVDAEKAFDLVVAGDRYELVGRQLWVSRSGYGTKVLYLHPDVMLPARVNA
jgi:hypothetical protein